MAHYATVTKIYTFSAAHSLEHHRGKCQHLHGHTYVLEVSVRGPVKPVAPGTREGPLVMGGIPREDQAMPGETIPEIPAHEPSVPQYASDCGMVIDFAEITALVDTFIAHPNGWDHRDLNDVSGTYPTAENLAHALWFDIEGALAQGWREVRLARIKLWETPTSCVEVVPEDRA